MSKLLQIGIKRQIFRLEITVVAGTWIEKGVFRVFIVCHKRYVGELLELANVTLRLSEPRSPFNKTIDQKVSPLKFKALYRFG